MAYQSLHMTLRAAQLSPGATRGSTVVGSLLAMYQRALHYDVVALCARNLHGDLHRIVCLVLKHD